MVQVMVNLGKKEDRVLNIVKAIFGLKNKSETVNLIISRYGDKFLEPEMRPEYKEDLLKLDKGRFRKFASIDDLRSEIENI